jgi:hypothetical protein
MCASRGNIDGFQFSLFCQEKFQQNRAANNIPKNQGQHLQS